MTASFCFAVCGSGSEPRLKAEVAARHAGLLVPAFMRPQLVTWKARRPLPPDFTPDVMFARSWGLSLGRIPDFAAAAESWRNLTGEDAPFRWHVYPRIVPPEGVEDAVWSHLDGLAAGLPANPRSPWIADLICENSGEPVLLGARRVDSPGPACPGGVARAQLPADAPSRAWLKLEQALAWAGWDAPDAWTGSRALELGSSPGGISLALVRRGCHVDAIDPSPMHPAVLAETGPSGAKVTHWKTPVSALRNEWMRGPVDLLVSDLNLAPPVVIRYLERLQARARARRWIVTLKLNDEAMIARLPAFRERLASFAPHPPRILQLPANRQEVTVIAG